MLYFFPALEGGGTKIPPYGDIFDEPLCGRSSIRTKFADHVGDHVDVSPQGTVLVKSAGTESSNPPPPTVERFQRGSTP